MDTDKDVENTSNSFEGWSERGVDTDRKAQELYEKLLEALLAYFLLFRQRLSAASVSESLRYDSVRTALFLEAELVEAENNLLPTYYDTSAKDVFEELSELVTKFYDEGVISFEERMSLYAIASRLGSNFYKPKDAVVPADIEILQAKDENTNYKDTLKESLIQVAQDAYLLGYKDVEGKLGDASIISEYVETYSTLFADVSARRHDNNLLFLILVYLFSTRTKIDEEDLQRLTTDRVNNYALLIAMTEIIRWYELGYNRALLDSGESLKVWVTADDELVCNRCAPLHMKVFKANAVYPRPPLHPRCRCRIRRYRDVYGI